MYYRKHTFLLLFVINILYHIISIHNILNKQYSIAYNPQDPPLGLESTTAAECLDTRLFE